MADAKRDTNSVTTLLGVSNADGVTPVVLWADPVTHRLLVDLPSGSGTVTSVSVVTANGVSGSVATATTTPAITLTLGAITPTSVNGLTISTTTGTFTLTNGKTLTVQSSLTIVGTDGESLTLTKGLTVTTNAGTLAFSAASKTLTISDNTTVPIATQILTFAGLTAARTITFPDANITVARTDAANTFTGHQTIEGVTSTGATGTNKLVFDTSPTLVTPVLGVATATSINGLTLTSSTGVVTVTNGKTITVSDSTTLATNSITFAGGEVITFSATNALSLLTSGTTVMTFPAATDTVAVLGTAQTYTALLTQKQVNWTNNAITASGNAATVPITHRLQTVTNNSAATLTITITTTSAVDGQLLIVRILDFSAVAQTITWVNTENSTVTAPTTSNASTTLFLTVGFIYNGGTSKWRCIASA